MNYSNLEEGRPLRNLTTIGIGGEARWYIEIHQIEQMQSILKFCHQESLPYFILGKGSNTLFDDRGFNGVVIANRIHFMNESDQGLFHVAAGYSFSLLGSQTARKGWSGLEFASGIPGSVGGAVFMNAGANGSETCDSLIQVQFITHEGELKVLKRSELQFDYRTSSFQSIPGSIISASFQLQPSETARQRQLEIIRYRQMTQPYSEKSAGCIFRNPSMKSAGALIDQAGLKGLKVGGAKVSTLHANFIVAEEAAYAQDVIALIDLIRDRVKESLGVELESEVRYIPYE
jgi:UDP-N-acetylmuramate dehydrogenase